MTPPESLPAGRAAAVASFERLLDGKDGRWVMLIEGFSGTGKSYLLEWLRANRCSAIPTIALAVGPGFELDSALRRNAERLGKEIGRSFRTDLERIHVAELQQPLVHHAPVQTMEASRRSALSQGTQSADLHIDMEAMAQVFRDDRNQRRLDAFVDAIDQVRGDRMVVLVDDTEQFARFPELETLVIDQLVGRLRDRFPRLRLCLAGQTVPNQRFEPRERVITKLGALDIEGTRAMLAGFDVVDNTAVNRVFELTSGHPLLIAMEAENRDADGDQPLGAGAGVGDRTRWIFDRVVARLDDPGARTLAPDLVLLDWFDLGILRAVFGSDATEAGFRELTARSFTKKLPDGRHTCHDAVRLHLPAQRWETDPERCRNISRAAFTAYVDRLADEETQRGLFEVPGRLAHVSAALNAALSHDRGKALSFASGELAAGISRSTDHAYQLSRILLEVEDPAFDELAHAGRRVLSALSLRSFDRDAGEHLVRFGNACEQAGRTEDASKLLALASSAMCANGRWIDAADVSRQSLSRFDDPVHATRLVEALLAGRDGKAAHEALVAARERFGVCPDVLLVEARFSAEVGEIADAESRLRAVIESIPGRSLQARLQLAHLFADHGEVDRAMSEIDLVLRSAPDEVDALELKLDLLSAAGRVDDALGMIARHSRLGTLTSFAGNNELSELADRRLRLLLLEQLEHRRDMSVGAVLMLAHSFAGRGECDDVDRLGEMAVQRWPAAAQLLTVHRARARLLAGRPEECWKLLAPLIEIKTTIPAAYMHGFEVLVQLNRPDEARGLLDQLAACAPTYAGVAAAVSLRLVAHVEGVDAVIATIAQMPPELASHPMVQTVAAILLMQAGRDSEAFAILEEHVYTDDVQSLPYLDFVAVRQAYALLLAKQGRPADASQVARELATRFPGDEAVIVIVATIFGQCGDDGALRDLQASLEDDLQVKLKVIGIHADLVLRQTPDVDALIHRFEKEPERIEIAYAAIAATVRVAGDASAVLDRLMHVAPGTAQKVIALWSTWETQDSPSQIEAIRAQIARQPKEVTLVMALVESLARAQRFEETLVEASRATASWPDHAETFTAYRTLALVRMGRLDEAAMELEPLLSREELPPAIFEMAIIEYLKAREDVDRVVKFLCAAARVRPGMRPFYMAGAADALTSDGRCEEALELLRDVEDSNPDNRVLICVARMRALNKLNREEEALQMAEQALGVADASPSSRALIHRHCGRALRKLARREDAIAAYRTACSLDDDAAGARIELSELMEETGDIVEAADLLMQAIAIDPSLKAKHRDRIARLEKLANPP